MLLHLQCALAIAGEDGQDTSADVPSIGRRKARPADVTRGNQMYEYVCHFSIAVARKVFPEGPSRHAEWPLIGGLESVARSKLEYIRTELVHIKAY